MFADAELTELGFTPHHLGDPVDVVIVHTDHPEYRDLGPEDLPGVRTVVDGRRVLDPARFRGLAFGVVGAGGAARQEG
jgi:UDP-N-acetyl-D-mannosaminuronate dehydrogenase